MNYIVTLHLNEIGRKALGVDKKTIFINAKSEDSVTGAIIDKVFPVSLVESYNAKPSFMDLPKGSYVAVVKDGVRYLGEILDLNWYCGNRILVKVYMCETYTTTIEFHPNGVEVTHNKNKYCLDNISDDEVETIKNKLKNEPFIKLISMLLDTDDVKIDGKTPNMPEWLTPETVVRINKILDSDFDAYYND